MSLTVTVRQKNTAAWQHLNQFHQSAKVRLLLPATKQPTYPINAARSICGIARTSAVILFTAVGFCLVRGVQTSDYSLSSLTDDERLSASRLNVKRLYLYHSIYTTINHSAKHRSVVCTCTESWV
jgi:hypothetical protein